MLNKKQRIMRKKLLTISLLAAWAAGASAYDVNDCVYTKTGKYRIIDANMVVNGKFTEGVTNTDGWNATSPSNASMNQVFTVIEDGHDGSNALKVNDGQSALTAGTYQKIPVTYGSYVVTVRVKGQKDGFTDLDLSGTAPNYINAYFNTDGAFATKSGTNGKVLEYGENGVSGGYGFSFKAGEITEVTFAIDAPGIGFIMIDFRGMAGGLEISDVECHAAFEEYDDRVAQRRLDYFRQYFNNADLTGCEYYTDMTEMMAQVEQMISSNAASDELRTAMLDTDALWEDFTAANFSNIINIIPTTDGSDNTGNNSSNWMNWTKQYSSLSTYSGKAPWQFSTSRWGHNSANAGTPIGIQWQRGQTTNWDNIATLTATLDKGTYFWGVSAEGGMMTLNKNRYARSWAKECAATELFFNGDTTEVFYLDPANINDYVSKFEVTEDNTTMTLGIRCNTAVIKDGFNVKFYNPVLYKILVQGELTPEQKAYLEAMQTQMDILKGRMDLAAGYMAEEQKEMPWGKADLTTCYNSILIRYDAWAAMTQQEILDKMDNMENMSNIVLTEGVNVINSAIKAFTVLNIPFTDIPVTISEAEELMQQRIYFKSTKKQMLTDKVATTNGLYQELLLADYSEEAVRVLENAKSELLQAMEEYKEAVPSDKFIDINFGTQDNPATIVTHEDPEQLSPAYYTIDGQKGTMVLYDITGTNSYELGYNETDSLGMLRIGNSTAEMMIDGTLPMAESDIVNVKFDLYVGNLADSYVGFQLLTEDKEMVCGTSFAVYRDKKPNIRYSSFDDFDVSKIERTTGNAAIAALSNRTQFDIVLDYGTGLMYCTTTSKRGTQTTQPVAIPTTSPIKQLAIHSTYATASRRCFIDNIVVNNIAADPTGVSVVESTETGAENNAIYNVMGQKLSAPVKGQIVVSKGMKYVY